MAQDIFPLAIWPENAQQARFPANDNALRMEAALAKALGVANSAPGSPDERDQYIVGTTWGGFAEDSIVVYLGGSWNEFVPPEGLIKTIGSDIYRYASSGWVLIVSGSSVIPAPLIVETTSNRDVVTDDAGSYIRYTGTGAKTCVFDVAEGFVAPQEFHVANRAASGNLTLSGTGVTLRAPKGGTLVLAPGDTVTVKFIDTDEADVFGSTVAA